MYGVFVHKRVQRMINTANGPVPEPVDLATFENCRVLTLKGVEPGQDHHKAATFDQYDREFQEIVVESQPGRPVHRLFSGDPDVIARLRALKRNDLITGSGVRFSNGQVRVEKFDVVKTVASTAPVPTSAS